MTIRRIRPLFKDKSNLEEKDINITEIFAVYDEAEALVIEEFKAKARLKGKVYLKDERIPYTADDITAEVAKLLESRFYEYQIHKNTAAISQLMNTWYPARFEGSYKFQKCATVATALIALSKEYIAKPENAKQAHFIDCFINKFSNSKPSLKNRDYRAYLKLMDDINRDNEPGYHQFLKEQLNPPLFKRIFKIGQVSPEFKYMLSELTKHKFTDVRSAFHKHYGIPTVKSDSLSSNKKQPSNDTDIELTNLGEKHTFVKK